MTAHIMYARRWPGTVLLAAAMVSCGGGAPGEPAESSAPVVLSAAAEAGKALFFDTSLSASGAQSCSTCHVPARAFTADPSVDHGLPVPLGGRNMDLPGFRNAPSLSYASFTPGFSIASGNTPTGGFFRDGRASSLAEQAQLPFVTSFEMANVNAAELVMRLQHSSATLAKFVAAYGQAPLADPPQALRDIGLAIAAFESEDPAFHPFTSKYDYWLQGNAQLTSRELQGLTLFNDPAKGNCAHCHISRRGNDGTPPQFTDYGLIALGVPRNRAIPANADPGYFDLGLCGPLRRDLAAHPEYCGLFKTPSLRNVALRRSFFHNGVFHSLRQVIEFYVERDTDPGKWYARRQDGSVDKFDDLPARYHANVNTEPPFDRHPGNPPALGGTEIDDLVAFLETLTDGYAPPH